MDQDYPDLIPISEAAAELGVEPKRLLGYCMSPLPWMPISDGRLVYRWSLGSVRKILAARRAADRETVSHE